MHWPLLFVYPETMQMDAVEDASEHDSLAAHLDAMFAEDAPPLQWDSEHAYTRSRIETYYLSHGAKPLGLEQLTQVRKLTSWARNVILANQRSLPCMIDVRQPCMPVPGPVRKIYSFDVWQTVGCAIVDGIAKRDC